MIDCPQRTHRVAEKLQKKFRRIKEMSRARRRDASTSLPGSYRSHRRTRAPGGAGTNRSPLRWYSRSIQQMPIAKYPNARTASPSFRTWASGLARAPTARIRRRATTSLLNVVPDQDLTLFAFRIQTPPRQPMTKSRAGSSCITPRPCLRLMALLQFSLELSG